jgi:hypothetical protein
MLSKHPKLLYSIYIYNSFLSFSNVCNYNSCGLSLLLPLIWLIPRNLFWRTSPLKNYTLSLTVRRKRIHCSIPKEKRCLKLHCDKGIRDLKESYKSNKQWGRIIRLLDERKRKVKRCLKFLFEQISDLSFC